MLLWVFLIVSTLLLKVYSMSCCLIWTSSHSFTQELCGPYVFLIFAALLLFFLIFTFFRVPETRGKTFDQIATNFHQCSAAGMMDMDMDLDKPSTELDYLGEENINWRVPDWRDGTKCNLGWTVYLGLTQNFREFSDPFPFCTLCVVNLISNTHQSTLNPSQQWNM